MSQQRWSNIAELSVQFTIAVFALLASIAGRQRRAGRVSQDRSCNDQLGCQRAKAVEMPSLVKM